MGPDTMLASADAEGVVRLWHPATGDPPTVIAAGRSANACADVGGILVVGLDNGLLAVALA
jgi:hypothetical protein